MKRGSKAITCDMCKTIVAWTIPTGEYDHGIKRVIIQERPNCRVVDIGMSRHYRCTECAKKVR